jgi:cytochrome c-type biogenesis protein CcmE
LVLLLIVGAASVTALVVYALGQNVMYFYSPSEVAAGKPPSERDYRLGGMVVKGSVKREADGLTVRFTLTDFVHEIPVTYKGLLPDLFREGQGIVAHGRRDAAGAFAATQLEAKHDEKYMPPDVAAALKAAQDSKNVKPGNSSL